MRKLIASALLGLGVVAGWSGGVEGPSQALAFPSVRWIPASSSNYTVRSSRTINLIVIHTVEGSEAGCISWFQNPRANVSAHYVVSHAGRITQMVRDKDMAWHARSAGNLTGIGIENEGYANRNTWTSAQLSALADLVRGLCDRYGIPKDRAHIKGHKEIPGNDHTDPGPYFPWDRFMQMVRGGSSGSGGGSTPPPPPPPSNGGEFAVETTASSLNVRSSVMGTILGQVPAGARFVVRGQQSGWFRINWRGREAWVSGQYTKRVGDDGVTVTAGDLNVRTGASTNNTVLGQVHAGQRYVVFGQDGEWRQIQFDQRRAWVHGGYTNPARF